MDFFSREENQAIDHGYQIGLKASIVMDILRTHPLIAGKSDGEDSAGRARLREANVEEVLDMAFALADGFVERAAVNGWIKATTVPVEQAAVIVGIRRGFMEKAQYSPTIKDRLEAVMEGVKERAKT